MKNYLLIISALFAASVFADSTIATKTYVDGKFGQAMTAVSNAVPKDSTKVEIGSESSAASIGNVAVGPHTTASGTGAAAVGNYSEARGSYTTAVGVDSHATNTAATAIGRKANAGYGGTAIGNSTTAGQGGTAVGNTANASGQSGIAIGDGAVASGNQSFAIGRGAKATHTASGAIGPMAETDRDSSLRIKYGIDEIFIGFWYPKSLGDYIREMAPAPDESLIRNLAKDEVSKADHMPTKWYTVRGGVTQEVVEIRTTVSSIGGNKRTILMYFEPQTDDDMLSMQMKNKTLVTFQSGSGVSVQDGAKITLGKPDRLLVNGSTNLEQYVQAAKPADYETVKAKANGAAPQSTTYTKTETDELIAENKPEYEDLASNVVWRIEADGARFFFKPVRPVHTED